MAFTCPLAIDLPLGNWTNTEAVYGLFLVGPLKKYRNIEANQVAKELFNAINSSNVTSNYLVEVHESQ